MSRADKHQLKILKDTISNPLKTLLGGPSVEEAERLLREKFGYSQNQIDTLRS